jgi:hypothetical protein
VHPSGAVGPPPATLKGWQWGAPDGLASWGENIVDRTTFVAASGVAIVVDLDRPIFGGLSEECHLSVGDSGGPWFLQEGESWYLAGVSSLVSGPFQHDVAGAPDGQPFDAALFDKGGLWEGNPGFFNTDQFVDTPSSAFAVRISSRDGWLLPLLDSDDDSVPDDSDNCLLVANPLQTDTDGDGYGNICDCDFDQSGACGIPDFGIFIPDLQMGIDMGTGTDMTGDGTVGIPDFSAFIQRLGSAPGPSALVP